MPPGDSAASLLALRHCCCALGPQRSPDPEPHHTLVQCLSQIVPDAEGVVLHGHRLALAVCQR
eukprot:14673417-Heterocapsa_arctica.AAC.1